MASISSLGIGSGLDLSSLLENLLTTERLPVENSIARQENKLATELSGIGIFRGAISSFQASLSGLDDPSTYTTRTTANTNTSAMSSSVTSDAAVGSYEIDVTNLAEKHSLASAGGLFSSLNDVVGTGTLQIKFGTITGPGFTSFAANPESTVQTLTIDSSNNTLSGLKDYINDGDYGVNATIINDGSGYRLTLQSASTGVDQAMELTVTDSGDGNDIDALGLSRLAFNASATQMSETIAAEDASLVVNGITVTSSTNTLNNMIDGVNLTLLEETSGSPLTFSINENTTAISSAITKAVEGYNTMMASLNDLGKAGPEGTDAGILIGDSVLRTFINGVKSRMTGTVDGLTGSITALSTIGISTQIDGSLSIDSTVFDQSIAENPSDALALFAPLGQLSDSNIDFNNFSDQSVPGNYAVNITQIAQRSTMTGGTGLSVPITIDGNNDDITFKIDGISTGALSLTQATYTTGAELATEIQLQINSAAFVKDVGLSVAVTYDTGTNGFVITSNQYGSSSLVEITAVDTNTSASLGLSVASAVAGQDVAGTIGGIAATGTGQVLESSTGDTSGLSLTIDGGTLGSRGDLQFTRGLIESMNSFLNGYLSSDGILSAKEEGLNESIDGLQDDRESLDRRMETLEQSLIAQFSALDALVASFQSTGNFLTQQLDSLPGFTRDK